jgi:alkylated DNA repair dioxygenase AlkB
MLDIEYFDNFLDWQETKNLFQTLINEVPWQEEYIKIFGNSVKCPRKVFWYGDSGIIYKYSGVSHQTSGWLPNIKNLKDSIKNSTNYDFNFALLNYYANGMDYMGWHSDAEKSLGDQPIIASISLGSRRDMLFKNKRTNELYKLNLNNGSLLIMKGNTQTCWLHSIPKRKNILEARINLTFRNVKFIT